MKVAFFYKKIKGERMNSLIYAAQMYLKISIISLMEKGAVIVKVSEDQPYLLIDVTLL
jgi:hypothetical protein